MSIDHAPEEADRDPLPPGIAFDPWERLFSEDMKRGSLPDRSHERIPGTINAPE